MVRQINLRQIEAFKATIECGSVSRAAELMGISQPAASKLLAHLEDDVGLSLFDRQRGRLLPNKQGMRFYDEVQRIFAGIRQVERAAETIRREEQGRLTIGVMPGLSGQFIQRVVADFLLAYPETYVIIKDGASRYIADWVATRQIDIGIISERFDNPNLTSSPLLDSPMACILPLGHRLSAKETISPSDINGERFISFAPESQTRQLVEASLDAHNIRVDVVVEAGTAPTVCEFVAAGRGISIVHPLLAHPVSGRVTTRPFRPEISYGMVLCRSREARDVKLVDAFISQARLATARVFSEIVEVEAHL
ncbi:LysR substrate-binding domain-containing protein (plasmid) [Agrobacterium rosae]|uniref:LysR substrate-binding domain-containing protein n=1 Tax=Agrobacterium rosae TaxID=1972867 RepID=A0AAW9FK26_9HYPH|nr:MULTISPECIES: LysR substrate-binding domain-containing protein [Agrobacterium]MDX8321456.1 LysR substrate-binding domain-containing protein [Agrobacterium sp. rho-8.1]MDX8305491.1 LysR substrate-binding domain-containing protein [Agrobacterium rosae]MDX8310999.1 LysR substrate-binding domain-containing protein [Agrobacterium sp. rho-13.3]MDX8316866.1 LysR substrate-binding domain-containing protein [Agrobacterium rosae]MDX8327263.1 LysR substrate-binding domain-containing protein [Agrobacte